MVDKRRSRRVPEELRKRSEQSCDLCRKRRCRCIPSGESCQTCIRVGEPCSYNLPRKTRFYGSADDLSERHRCLEVLVRGAFPDDPLDTVQDLLNLGNRHGYAMPDVRPEPKPTPSSLVCDSYGNTHYIGPSGSLSFFAELREIIKSRQNTSEFVSDNTTKALEADEEQPEPDTPASIESLLKQFSGRARPDPTYLEALPPNGTIEILLESFFSHVHPDFSIFHRASFHDEFEMYIVQPRTGTVSIGGPDWGWLACLHMILVFGSISLKDDSINHDSLRRDSLSAVTNMLPNLISKCTLSNLQALLLKALFLHNHNERNGAWNLLGTAARSAIALGLHEIGFNTSFRPIQREIRKRVFCTLFSFEQFLSSSLGRPSGLDESDIDVTAPRNSFFDDDGFGDQYIIHHLRLQKLLGKTRVVLANKQPAADLLRERDRWQTNLPVHLQLPTISNSDEVKLSLSRQPPHQLRKLLVLHIQQHYIGLLVSRPALLQDMAKSSTEPSPSAEQCEHHASQSARLLMMLDDFGLVNGVSALDIFYAYQAAMVLLLRRLKYPSQNQQMLDRLRSIMSNTRKCGTMKRFVAVVDKFSQAVNGPRVEPQPQAQQTHFDANMMQPAMWTQQMPAYTDQLWCDPLQYLHDMQLTDWANFEAVFNI